MNKKYLAVSVWYPDDVAPQTLSIIYLDHDKSEKYNHDESCYADSEFETVFETFGRIADCLTEVSYASKELMDTFPEAQKN